MTRVCWSCESRDDSEMCGRKQSRDQQKDEGERCECEWVGRKQGKDEIDSDLESAMKRCSSNSRSFSDATFRRWFGRSLYGCIEERMDKDTAQSTDTKGNGSARINEKNLERHTTDRM